MAFDTSSPFSISKRTRDEGEVESPSGKRTRTIAPVLAPEAPQIAPPTPNFVTSLAQQRQQEFERMDFGSAEREDTEMDGGDMSDGSTTSNPRHPWNLASPPMAHQASSNSLSNSSIASSSMPTTPLDGQFHYAGYPSHSNPTSFTDMNGTIHTFSNPPPPSPADSAPTASTSGPISHGFLAQAHANAQAKLQQSTGQPSYGWDMPRQSNNFVLGGHLV
ncbi:uncharacterized protein JCM15063_004615 [Sporobolomyces koalae]|uniref:uncharacterized protein n=1 Tax=Sporobolomyces koalae TaxID=500713 RepID=UPI003174DBE7